MHVPTVRNVVCLTKTNRDFKLHAAITVRYGRAVPLGFFYSVMLERKLLRTRVFDVDR